MAVKQKTWPLEAHTRAKHEILRRYLEAWTPILGAGSFPMIAYVDGFAGPGIYEGGEEGSPIIALRAALQHQQRVKSTLLFLFIEKDIERARLLEQEIKQLALPANYRWKVAEGESFEEGFRRHLLDHFVPKGRELPPTFAFIDPFGWTGVPFALVAEILRHGRCEVLINIMYEEINRFLAHPEQPNNFDVLFGTTAWRDALRLEGVARREFIHELYLAQLRRVGGARYVRSFEMRNKKNATDYFLFFATNSRKGIEKMKEAMWKVDESGEFRFSDATNPAQVLLFEKQPNLLELRRQLLVKFAGTTATVDEIEEFVLAETSFRETHYKKRLAELEREGRVVAVDPPRNRRGHSYPDPRLVLRFEPLSDDGQ
jgi:three-Cys-motif partner protein